MSFRGEESRHDFHRETISQSSLESKVNGLVTECHQIPRPTIDLHSHIRGIRAMEQSEPWRGSKLLCSNFITSRASIATGTSRLQETHDIRDGSLVTHSEPTLVGTIRHNFNLLGDVATRIHRLREHYSPHEEHWLALHEERRRLYHRLFFPSFFSHFFFEVHVFTTCRRTHIHAVYLYNEKHILWRTIF
jgi:hypothetical protein